MGRLIADMARWLRGLLFYLVVPAALAALLAWEFLLPRFVERTAGDWLAKQGHGDIAFEVRHVGLTRVEITGLSGDAGRLAVSDITAFYDLDGLFNGRIERVVIGGARWRTEFEDGRLRFGPFERFFSKPDARGAATRPPVYVAEVVLRDARLEIATRLGDVTVPLDGRARLGPDGAVAGALTMRLEAPFAAFDATVDIDLAADGAVDAYADITRGWLDGFGTRGAGLAVQVAGRRDALGGVTIDGFAEAAHLAVGGLAMPGSAEFGFDGDRARLDLRVAAIDEALVANVAAVVTGIARGAPKFTVSAELTVASPEAMQRRSFSVLRLESRPPRLALSARGAVTDLAALLAARGPAQRLGLLALEGDLRIDLTGVTVPRLVEGFGATGDLSFDLSDGALTARSGGLDLTAARVYFKTLGLNPGPWLAPYLDDALEVRIRPAAAPLLGLAVTPSGATELVLAGRLEATLGQALSAHGAVDRVTFAIDPAEGRLRLNEIEGAVLAIDEWHDAPLGLSVSEARMTLSGADGRYAGLITAQVSGSLALGERVRVANGTAWLDTAFAYADRRLRLTVRDRDLLSLGAVRIDGPRPIDVAPLAIALAPDAETTVLEARLDNDGSIAWQVSAGFAPVQVAARFPVGEADPATIDIALPLLLLNGSGRVGGEAMEVQMTLSGRGGEARIRAPGEIMPGLPRSLSARGIDIDVKATDAGTATVRVDLATLAHDAARPLVMPMTARATATLDKAGVDFNLRFTEPSGNVVLDLSGRHDVARGAGAGTVKLHPVRFLEGGFQPDRLSPYAADRIGATTGTVTVDGDMNWSDGGLVGDVRLVVENLNTSFDEIQILDLDTTILFDRLLPPSTPPGQRVNIGGVTLGLPLTDGTVWLHLDKTGAALIERSEWRWAGGKVITSSEPGDGGLLVLDVDAIELDKLLDLTPEGVNLQATGKLNGRVPVVFRDGEFHIVEGWLESSYDGGVIRYSPHQMEVGLLAGGQGVKLLLDALKDFRYSRMRVDLVGRPDGEIDLKFRIRGSNPEVYGGAEFELNLNITGKLDEILRDTYKAYYRVPEAAAREAGQTGRTNAAP